MNWEKLDQQLTEIVIKRNQLSQMDYSDDSYDDLEEELHDLEDDFNEEYEEAIVDLSNRLIEFKDTVESMQGRLIEIDTKGSFESDDEVGFFFQELKIMSEEINNFFESEEKNSNQLQETKEVIAEEIATNSACKPKKTGKKK
jgi:hypothetical protein